MRKSIVLAILMICGGSAAATQPMHRVALRIELPSGETREIRAREGEAAVQVELFDGQAYRDFYLRLVVREEAGRVLLVSVRDGRGSDADTLDEFELVVGGDLRRTRTSPSFALALLQVDDL